MKLVNTQEYVSMLRELTEQGREVNMLISGNSMSPFLMHGRDSIRLKKPDRKLRKGDMVFFQRKSGKFVMHRLLFIRRFAAKQRNRRTDRRIPDFCNDYKCLPKGTMDWAREFLVGIF